MSELASTDENRRQHARTGRKRLGRVAKAFLILSWPAWALGQLTRDANWACGLLFYIPSPLVVATMIIAAVVHFRAHRPRRATVLIALALAPLAAVLFAENRFFARPEPATTNISPSAPLRVVHWNVMSGRLGWDAITSDLRDRHADLYILSEIPDSLDTERFAAKLGPEYRCVRFPPMAAAARGGFASGRWLVRRRTGRIARVVWTSDRGRLTILAADLTSRLGVARDPLLRELVELIREERPDLVAGDFNAPRRSRALAELPAGWTHAYEAVGRGWSYTWPVPCPLWAIDQLITGPRIQPLRYELDSTLRSDHRLQSLDFLTTPSSP